MNEPAYREEHKITARPGEEVKETATYTEAEWDQMNRLTVAYYVLENFGVLRQVATYVHAETGQREIDFYDRLVEEVHADPDRWPLTMLALQVLPELMVPPVSWRLLLDEVRDYLVEQIGLADDDALDTVMAVQHALLPARTVPSRSSCASPTTTARGSPRSATFASAACTVTGTRKSARWGVEPGTFTVNDPFDVCTTALGGSLRSLMVENAWDLESSVSRPRQRLNDDDPLAGIGGQ